MKRRDFHRLSRQYLREFEDDGTFYIYRDMLLHLPFNPVLRGISFDGSGFSKTKFTASVFAQNLLVPFPAVSYNYGNRFGFIEGSVQKWWDLEKRSAEEIYTEIVGDIRTEAIPFLLKVSTPNSFYDFIEARLGPGLYDPNENSELCENMAFLATWFGGKRDAHRWLQQGIVLLERKAEYDYQFQRLERLREVMSTLAKSEEDTKALLLSYFTFTANAIGLPGNLVEEWLKGSR